MRILMLTQWFNPEPVFKGLTFARELSARGHAVEVLTGFPNYPGGNIYEGYRQRLWQREEMDGIPVTRVPLYPSHDRSSIRRAFNYGSFALSSALLGPALVKRPDVLYVYQPITIGLAAVALKLLRRVPFVIDIQDLWPEFLPATGMINNRTALWAIGKWCEFVYRQAERVTTLSPGFREAIIGRGIAPEKVEVVYNWCDEMQVDTETETTEELKRKWGMGGRFNVVFAGTMGAAQALDSVVDAAALLQGDLPEVQFVFVGTGVEEEQLKKKVQKNGITNVRFIPRQPLSEIGPLLRCADVQLVHLKDDPFFAITVPSKTQTSLAVGRPVLMAVRGDAADLVEQAQAGLTCAPENPAALADTVRRFYTMGEDERLIMGNNGQRYYGEHLSLKVGVDRFEEIFSGIAGRKSH